MTDPLVSFKIKIGMPTCPWNFLPLDKLGFCEEILCSWVKQPSNTWSNIGFVFVGILLWRFAKKEKQEHLKWFGPMSIVTGLGSAFFHASGTVLGGISDYFGMFLGEGYWTALNTRRWTACSFKTMYFICGATTGALVAAMLLFPGSERYLYSFASPCCLIELRLFFRDRRTTVYRRDYLYAFLALGLGTIFWWLDISGRLCEPTHHILTGHALWHLLLAVSLFFIYRFYTQFELLRPIPDKKSPIPVAAPGKHRSL